MQASSSPSPTAIARDLYNLLFTLNQRASRDLFQMLREMELSITQFKLLHFLTRMPDERGHSVKMLGEQFGLSLAAASRAVEGLHQRGLVARAECPDDRRSKRVTITAAGREALDTVHSANVALLATFTAQLPDEQRRALAEALSPLLALLDVEPSKNNFVQEGPS